MVYYLVSKMLFDSLYSLIWHYMNHPLKADHTAFEFQLTDPVAQPNAHVDKEYVAIFIVTRFDLTRCDNMYRWYFEDMDRSTAEATICQVKIDGAFLIRKCADECDNCASYALSFRYVRNITRSLVRVAIA